MANTRQIAVTFAKGQPVKVKPSQALRNVTTSRVFLQAARNTYRAAIREARKDHTLQEIADAAGVSKAAIHKTLKTAKTERNYILDKPTAR